MSRQDLHHRLGLSSDAHQQLALVMDHAHRQIELILQREIARLQARAQEIARQEAVRSREVAMRVLGDQHDREANCSQKAVVGHVQPLLLRDVQVAQMLGIHRNTVWNRVRQRKFPAPIKWDGLTVWRRQDIEAFVKALDGEGAMK